MTTLDIPEFDVERHKRKFEDSQNIVIGARVLLFLFYDLY
jgi:hypothetical protein